MRISVFGIGYVGAVTSACLAETGHQVIAVDTDAAKVKAILNGQAPVVEAGLSNLIQKHAGTGNLKATDQCGAAINASDISLICVGTPSDENGALRLDFVENVCREIGTALRNKNSYHCVVLRSTMLPGSAMDIILPILENSSGKKAGVDFGFGNNPEFLREGSAIEDYFNPPKIVIGAIDEQSAAMIAELYQTIEAPRAVTDINVAEGVKYADNAWHAMKIGFANEMGNILKLHKVDSHAVMDIFCLDTKLNISKAYLKPGFAFGGSCLPKDLRALQAGAAVKGLKTVLFDALLQANDMQVERGLALIEQSDCRNVGMIGLAFKPGTDDLRESPLLKLADILSAKNYALKIYDPALSEAVAQRLVKPSNILDFLIDDPAALYECDLLVIGHKYNGVYDIVCKAAENIILVDLVRLDERLEKRAHYHGICW